MLNLVFGRAGVGKTAVVMNDIRRKMDAGESNLLLIVPEQYSHDAERQLCAVCGDKLSLYGEVLSFTRLCSLVFSELGCAPTRYLDAGGQMIVMHRALESVASKLKVYGRKGLRIELLKSLLGTIKEFKVHNISADSLMLASERAKGTLADKLYDFALVYSAYEGLLVKHGKDPMDRLTLLAEVIADSNLASSGYFYFDGFNDFTMQEMNIIEELLRKNAHLTVCLTYDSEDSGEIFELPRKTANRLKRLAEKYAVEVRTRNIGTADCPAPGSAPTQESNTRADELVFLEKRLFSHNKAEYPNKCEAVSVYAAPSAYAECEYAAHTALGLARFGYRWRDISVMARDWEEYGAICENVFERYGIPFFSGGRTDVLDKPAAALIDSALDIAVSGWEYKSTFRYLKLGLSELTDDDVSLLENYVLMWNIRGFLWERDWTLPTSGYGGEVDPQRLERLNQLRVQVITPILRLRQGIKGVSSVGEKLNVLYSFLDEIDLPKQLANKAKLLGERGEARLADEYSQLWNIIVNSMERMFEVLNDTDTDAADFRKLLGLVISQYDIGVIPTSLDRVSLGGMPMSRKRNLKCLIVIGATDERLPKLTKTGGILSDSEKMELAAIGIEMPMGVEDRIIAEMNMIYSTLTLPSERLFLMYPTDNDSHPSFVVKRVKSLFGLETLSLREEEYMVSAETPYRELLFIRGGEAVFDRGKLSEKAVRSLYGKKISMSPTRAEKYYSCPYHHFMNNGLKLSQRLTAGFDAPQAGVFMHTVLEGIAREIKKSPGFKNTSETLCRALTAMHIELYVDNVLQGFEGKNARFVYLFKRLEENVSRIAFDMVNELRDSDFEPLDFELDISEIGLRGIIDRVDGWKHGGKQYIRVIDYKTGKKSFSLSDVLYGKDMQMLIYLFALAKYGAGRYGDNIVPAGVLYVPARDFVLQMPRNSTDGQIEKKRANELRRRGLILNDSDVLDAMENSDIKKFLPVKQSKDGGLKGDSLVNTRQIACLSEHIDMMLTRAADEILNGRIECYPYYKNDNDNACLYCQYKTICGFDEDCGDKRNFARNMSAGEVWEELGVRELRNG